MAIDDGIIRQSGDLGIVEMNLAMHAATPKLEAFYNYYEDTHNNSRGHECGSWVDWYGEVVCDVEGLAHLVGTEAIDASDNLNKRYVFISFTARDARMLQLTTFTGCQQNPNFLPSITYSHHPTRF